MSETGFWSTCGSSFCLGCCYVASLYIWSSKHDRDHPSTIKRRFLSAFFMLFLSPPFLYYFGAPSLIHKYSLKTLMGIKTQGLVSACTFPLFLTWILFLGPIIMTTLSDTKIRLMLMPR